MRDQLSRSLGWSPAHQLRLVPVPILMHTYERTYTCTHALRTRMYSVEVGRSPTPTRVPGAYRVVRCIPVVHIFIFSCHMHACMLSAASWRRRDYYATSVKGRAVNRYLPVVRNNIIYSSTYRTYYCKTAVIFIHASSCSCSKKSHSCGRLLTVRT